MGKSLEKGLEDTKNAEISTKKEWVNIGEKEEKEKNNF
jgi:hypothetical protein